MRESWKYYVFLFILGLSTLASAFPLKPFSAIDAEAPVFKGYELPHEQYVAVETRELAHARIVWLNFEWLHENGFEVPKGGLTPSFEKEILSHLAYGIPKPSDAPELFTEKTKMFFADRYGGKGMGVNKGSGRAFSRGQYQNKGWGPVSELIGSGQPFDHAHGGLNYESMIEAIFGEVNQRELKHGSNRVIMIADTGVYTEWTDGTREKNFPMTRVDPLRAGHPLADDLEGEVPRRLRDVWKEHLYPFLISGIKDNLPHSVIAGMNLMVDKMAEHSASEFAKRIYPGTTSPGNYDIRGQSLDFGTETYLSSYQKVHVLPFVEPFGGHPLAIDFIYPYVDKGLLTKVQADELSLRYQRAYDRSVSKEMLLLTGAPPELVEKIIQKPIVANFGTELRKFAEQEFNEPVLLMDKKIPDQLHSTRLGAILKSGIETGKIEALVQSTKVSQYLKTKLTQGYTGFFAQLESAASAEGISKQALKTYMRNATEILHRDPSFLLRPNLIHDAKNIVTEYEKTKDRSKIWDFIDHTVQKSRRNPYSDRPFELVIEEQKNRVEGTLRRKTYDLKTNSYREELISLKKSRSENATAQAQKLCDAPLTQLRKIIR